MPLYESASSINTNYQNVGFLIDRDYFSIIIGDIIPNFKIPVKVLGTSVKHLLSVTVMRSGMSQRLWA